VISETNLLNLAAVEIFFEKEFSFYKFAAIKNLIIKPKTFKMNWKFLNLLALLMLMNAWASVADNYEISLKHKKVRVELHDYSIQKVIDARENTACIGFLHGGYNDSNRPIVFREGVTGELKQLFEKSFEPRAHALPLIITVNHLFVYEINNKEMSFDAVEINLDFYVKDGDEWYHEFQAAEHVISYQKTPTPQFEKMLTDALEISIEDFAQRMHEGLGYHRQKDEEELYLNGLNEDLHRQIIASNRTDGIYRSFNDYRDNLSITNMSFTVENSKPNREDNNLYTVRTIYDGKKLKDVWGIYYHDTLFVNLFDNYYPAVWEGEKLIIHDPPMMKHGDAAGTGVIVGAGVAFGLVGGIAAAVLMPVSNKPKTAHNDLAIDLATGIPSPVETPDFKIMKAQLVFYTDDYPVDEHSLQLIINDSLVFVFDQQSYLMMDVFPENNPVKICLKSHTDEHCEEFEAALLNTSYIEMLMDKKGRVDFFPKKSIHSITPVRQKIEEGKLMQIGEGVSL
jgi:hypothetical protein